MKTVLYTCKTVSFLLRFLVSPESLSAGHLLRAAGRERAARRAGACAAVPVAAFQRSNTLCVSTLHGTSAQSNTEPQLVRSIGYFCKFWIVFSAFSSLLSLNITDPLWVMFGRFTYCKRSICIKCLNLLVQ